MKSLSVRNLTRVAMFTALMCVLAYVFLQLPISPVAISAQTFGVMLAGLVLEPNLAALSQALYVLLGALGLPVFAGGASGIGILIGPKGGYLWGFIVGAYVTAAMIQKSEKNGKPIPLLMLAFASLIGGVIVVYAIGVLQLAVVAELPFRTAFAVGVLPFIPGDLAKVITASLIARRLRSVLP
ncbi:MAG: biotin transporter BioY [Firmicutes bacterium]|nr:biotin transporter BioY [Bacillota bacterium]